MTASSQGVCCERFSFLKVTFFFGFFNKFCFCAIIFSLKDFRDGFNFCFFVIIFRSLWLKMFFFDRFMSHGWFFFQNDFCVFAIIFSLKKDCFVSRSLLLEVFFIKRFFFCGLFFFMTIILVIILMDILFFSGCNRSGFISKRNRNFFIVNTRLLGW